MALVARATGATFGVLAKVRRGKPIHSRGVTLRATLRRYGGTRPWGIAWVDAGAAEGAAPRVETATVRLSRSAGLPAPLPDVMGLALRTSHGDGGLVDVLLSTTGTSPVLRHVLVPRREAVGPAYGSLLPYRGPDGPVLLAAFPDAGPTAKADSHSLLHRLAEGPVTYRLAVATPSSPWDTFAALELQGPVGDDELDPAVAFDPVLHPVPGLEMYDVAARLREAAYSAARRGRRARPGELTVEPGAAQASGS